MYLKFWGVTGRTDGEYSPKQEARPGWTYRGARRNAARIAHWPSRYRWRVWVKLLRARVAEELAKRGVFGLPA